MGRLQLALNVDDLDESIVFYSRLFGTEPAKIRPGYANFAVADPPLKLVLVETPGQGGSINHLGVEVEDVDTVDAIQARLAADGLASVDERGTKGHLTVSSGRCTRSWATARRTVPPTETPPAAADDGSGSSSRMILDAGEVSRACRTLRSPPWTNGRGWRWRPAGACH